MSSEAEKLLQKFVLMLEEKFDVRRKTSTNVLDLHLKGADSKEEANSLASMLKRVLKGDFGLYVLVSKEVGFWGPSESIISKLRSAYVEKWAMILLDGSPTIGHLYTPEDVANSCAAWSTNETGESYKIHKSDLGYHRGFIGKRDFWDVLMEAGAKWG